MAKATFPFKVKYKGAIRPAGVPFDIDGADVPEMLEAGAGIEEPEPAPEETPEEMPEPAPEAPPRRQRRGK